MGKALKKYDEKRETSTKELVGLVFKTDYKLTVEFFDETIESQLRRGKFDVSNLKIWN